MLIEQRSSERSALNLPFSFSSFEEMGSRDNTTKTYYKKSYVIYYQDCHAKGVHPKLKNQLKIILRVYTKVPSHKRCN